MSERKIRLKALGMIIILIVMVVLVFNRLGGQTNQSTYSGESVYSEPSTEQTSSITQESITQESITEESITEDEREQEDIDEYNSFAQDYREEKDQELQKAIQAQKDKGIYIEPKYLQDGSPNPRYGQ